MPITSEIIEPPASLRSEPDRLRSESPIAFTGIRNDLDQSILLGASWTTDAPFRETQAAIDAMHRRGILAVEMEAAALYAFGRARERTIVCFAHVTNQMGRVNGDFEKGEADGATLVMQIARRTAKRLRRL